MNIIELAPYCFLSMYHGSGIRFASITTQDKNPAIGSYSYMFGACSNLTEANFDLSAKTLAPECYMGMFANCDKLEVAPKIFAQNLPSEENAKCCASMFSGCESLSTIWCLAENNITGTSNNFQNWVYNVADSGTFHGCDGLWPTGDNGIPTHWVLEDATYVVKYFTIESLSDNNTIVATPSNNSSSFTMQYSANNGPWTNFWVAGSYVNIAKINTGQTVRFKASLTDKNPTVTFTGTGTFKVYGNLMSLTKNDNFIGASISNRVFSYLFKNSINLIDASNLILPNDVYQSSYSHMFEGCTSLTGAPKLPATSLSAYCYSGMFEGCTSLTTVPDLPATSLATQCYSNMFSGCTALINAPELPATTLYQSCYMGMFSGCTSLTTAPELPATTLPQYCYHTMFDGCSSLNYIKCLGKSKQNMSLTLWTRGVAASGTFVKASSSTIFPANTNGGIPSGWTVQNI